jgi:hypothetical protein
MELVVVVEGLGRMRLNVNGGGVGVKEIRRNGARFESVRVWRSFRAPS